MYGHMRHDLAVPSVDINCSMHGWDGNEARKDTPRGQGRLEESAGSRLRPWLVVDCVIR